MKTFDEQFNSFLVDKFLVNEADISDDARFLVELEFDLEESSYRVKSREDIREKSITRKSVSPVRDIYGVRFVVRNEDRFKITNLATYFPLTPDFFADGRPSVREYANPNVRSYIRGAFNPNIGEYSALHINIVFQRNNSKIYDIAEIQIMTKDELTVSKNNRNLYTNVRKNDRSTL